MKISIALLTFALPLLVAGQARAFDLPDPVSEENFEAVLTDSPFLRTLDPSELYHLRALATIDGKQVATLFSEKTKKSLIVSPEGLNEWGLKLVEVNPSDELAGVSVHLEMSGEEFELKYDAERLAQLSQSGGKRYEVQRDSRGRPIPPKELMLKYRSLNDDQRKVYLRWREAYYKKRPELERSEKRFPIVDKAIDAIKKGNAPPRP